MIKTSIHHPSEKASGRAVAQGVWMNNAQEILTADSSGFGLLSLHPFTNKVSSISLESKSGFKGINIGDNHPPPTVNVCCAQTGGSFDAPPVGFPSPKGISYTGLSLPP